MQCIANVLLKIFYGYFIINPIIKFYLICLQLKIICNFNIFIDRDLYCYLCIFIIGYRFISYLTTSQEINTI